jgi:hypothetical protein
VPEIAHHALAEQRGEHRFAVGGTELGQQQRGVAQRRPHNQRRVTGRERFVDHPAGEQRPGELHAGSHGDAGERRPHERGVGTHVREQAPHEAGVVGFPEGVVFGRGGCCGSDHAPGNLRADSAWRSR